MIAPDTERHRLIAATPTAELEMKIDEAEKHFSKGRSVSRKSKPVLEAMCRRRNLTVPTKHVKQDLVKLLIDWVCFSASMLLSERCSVNI